MRMPPKTRITKDMIIQAAIEVVKQSGYESINARTVSAQLHCSTQPVMYQFPNLELLKEQAYQRADAFHTAYLLEGEDLLEIGLRYIRFAQDEPRLFRFLFQTNRFSGLSLEDLIRSPETAGIMAVVGSEGGMDPEAAAAFFEPLAAVVHGYASLIANNAMKYDPDAVRNALTAIAEGLLKRKEML